MADEPKPTSPFSEAKQFDSKEERASREAVANAILDLAKMPAAMTAEAGPLAPAVQMLLYEGVARVLAGISTVALMHSELAIRMLRDVRQQAKDRSDHLAKELHE